MRRRVRLIISTFSQNRLVLKCADLLYLYRQWFFFSFCLVPGSQSGSVFSRWQSIWSDKELLVSARVLRNVSTAVGAAALNTDVVSLEVFATCPYVSIKVVNPWDDCEAVYWSNNLKTPLFILNDTRGLNVSAAAARSANVLHLYLCKKLKIMSLKIMHQMCLTGISLLFFLCFLSVILIIVLLALQAKQDLAMLSATAAQTSK